MARAFQRGGFWPHRLARHCDSRAHRSVRSGSEEAVPAQRQISLQTPVQQTNADLPSKVADDLFWLGRYAERVESRVRFVRALWPALSSEEDFGHTVSLDTAIRVLTGLSY